MVRLVNEAVRIDNARKGEIKQSNCSGTGIGALIGSIVGVFLRTRHGGDDGHDDLSQPNGEDGFWIVIFCALAGMVVGGVADMCGCFAEDPHTSKRRLQSLCNRTEVSTNGLLKFEIHEFVTDHEDPQKLRIEPTDNVLYAIVLTRDDINRRKDIDGKIGGGNADSDTLDFKNRHECQDCDVECGQRSVEDMDCTNTPEPNLEGDCGSGGSRSCDDDYGSVLKSRSLSQCDLEGGHGNGVKTNDAIPS